MSVTNCRSFIIVNTHSDSIFTAGKQAVLCRVISEPLCDFNKIFFSFHHWTWFLSDGITICLGAWHNRLKQIHRKPVKNLQTLCKYCKLNGETDQSSYPWWQCNNFCPSSHCWHALFRKISILISFSLFKCTQPLYKNNFWLLNVI